MSGLSAAERKTLHKCTCGHLIESHDFTGCFALACSCKEAHEGQLFTTTYATVERIVAAREAQVAERIAQALADAFADRVTWGDGAGYIAVADAQKIARGIGGQS